MLSKLKVDIDLDRMLLIHSANHANFLEPLLLCGKTVKRCRIPLI